jgi:hypothetical protein
MYRAFYSLAKRPFSKEIEPINMFASASYEEIMARLAFLKDSRDMGLVRLVPAKPRLCGLLLLVLIHLCLKWPISRYLQSQSIISTGDWLFLWILRRHSVRWIYSGKIQEAITELFYGKKITPLIIFWMNCS